MPPSSGWFAIALRKVTVLHLLQCTNLGGMEQVAYRLMERLSTSGGLEFAVLTPRPFGAGKSRLRAVDSYAADSPHRGRFGWRDAPKFKEQVEARAKSCSHIWISGTSVASLRAVRDLSQPKVLSHHYHHFENRWSGVKWRAFYEGFARNIDAITYPTRFTRDEAIRIAPWIAERAVVVPNGVQCLWRDQQDRIALRNAARKRLGVPEDAFVIGNAGWLIQRKRFDIFLSTAKKVLTSLPSARFVVCGGGPLEAELKSQARALGIENSVTFTGWVADLSDQYHSWDVMLFNSDFDTLPCGPLEAAAHGCIVVASLRYGGLSEFIHHNVNGFLLEDHDVSTLAQTVLALASDEALTARCLAALQTSLRSDYSVAAGSTFYSEYFDLAELRSE